MDAAFLKETVGPVLSAALLEVSLVRPTDPIEHLANLLLKVQQNTDDRAQEIVNEEQLKKAQESFEENARKEKERLKNEADNYDLIKREDELRRQRALAQKNIQICQQYALMMAKKRHERDVSQPDGYDAAHAKFLAANTNFFKKLNFTGIHETVVECPQVAALCRSFLLLFNYDPEFVKDPKNIASVLKSKRFFSELNRMDKIALQNSLRNMRRMVAARKEVDSVEDLYKYELSVAIMDEYMKGYVERHNGLDKDDQINSDTVTEGYESAFGVEPEEAPYEFAGTLPELDHKKLKLVPDAKYTIKLGWEMVSDTSVDLDAAVICYDKIGSVVDTVYFNKLSSKDGSLKHHGDENHTATEELLTFIPGKVSDNIETFCLVLNCNKEGTSFKDVQSGSFTIVDPEGNILATHSSKAQFQYTGYLLCIITRVPNTASDWTVILVGEPAKDEEDDGTNFMDAAPICVRFLEDNGIIPISSRSKRHCSNPYAMGRHEAYDVPPMLSMIHVGLGWNVMGGFKFDVDCSAVLFGNEQLVDFVNFDKLISNDRAIVHTGDNMTGEVEGDDEALKVDYSMIAPEVDTIFFVVTIYQEGTFDNVDGTFIRMVDENGGKELCRYTVPKEAGGYNGLILCKVTRQVVEGNQKSWKMTTLGKPGHGSTYEELLPDMEELLQEDHVDESVTKA